MNDNNYNCNAEYVQPKEEPKSNNGLLCMIMGIIGAYLSGLVINIPFCIIAILQSLQVKATNNGKLNAMGIVGLITGIIGLIGTAVCIVFVTFFLCIYIFEILFIFGLFA